jgi:hypothetical protein
LGQILAMLRRLPNLRESSPLESFHVQVTETFPALSTLVVLQVEFLWFGTVIATR